MELILAFPIKKFTQPVNIHQPILLVGSCFAEEIGTKMKERKFNAIINPHGILYNPISISQSLTDTIENKRYGQPDIFLHDELWRSFKHHGKFANTDAEASLANMNAGLIQAHHQLKHANWLFVTFGSAFAYKHNNTIVANCHKLPASQFEKVLLNKQQIVDAWQQQINRLKDFNPNLKIVFSVSPVRYIRDGIVENNRSKGILIDAVHTLIEQNPNTQYFPAYEIVIDELRSYRFYKEDLVHPSTQAVSYVWQKFVDSACDEETTGFITEYQPILKSQGHRYIHGDTFVSIKFREQLDEKINAIRKKYPSVW
jgi:hypothetical protein